MKLKRIQSLIQLVLLAFGLIPISVNGQTPVVDLAQPDDSGWIRLYDGTNVDDFYTIYNGPNTKGSFPDHGFVKGDGDTIRVTAAQVGHIIHKQPFSHYRAKFQFHYPNNSHGNSGMLFHIQPNDPMYNGLFPRSIESQGDPNQGIGQVWCIGNVWITIRLRPGNGPGGGYFGDVPIYDPTRPEVNYGNENQTGKRAAAGIDGWKTPVLTSEMNNNWTEMEIDVHSNDTIVHKVNGDTVIMYRDPRVALTADPDQVDANIQKRLTGGLLGWQAEGKEILYRNIMVKLYSEDPLYDQLYPVNISETNWASSKIGINVRENSLRITGLNNYDYRIEIRNVQGQLLQLDKGVATYLIDLNGAGLKPGVYTASIVTNGFIRNFKFIFF